MRRRVFFGFLVSTVTWQLAALAETARGMRRVGVILTLAGSDPIAHARVEAFSRGLREQGWREGENVDVEYRFADGDVSQVPALAQELINLRAEVIVTNAFPPINAVRQQNAAIPIVFAAMSDPVAAGLMKGLSQPDENITGFVTFEYSILGKWLELLKAVAPGVTRVGLVFSPDAAYRRGNHWLEQFHIAAASFAVTSVNLPVRNVDEMTSTVADFGAEQGGGLLVVSDTFTSAYHAQIAAAAAQDRIPGCYGFRYFATDGGLMSYGPDSTDLYRQSASYVSRLLRGEKMANLPVQHATKFELVINIKTAKAMGLTVPPWLLARADEVIE
jgi:putative tryptophan/tyrosine transport system substrate-binding protein